MKKRSYRRYGRSYCEIEDEIQKKIIEILEEKVTKKII